MPLIQEIVEESFITPSDPTTPIPLREGAHYDGCATNPNCLASGLCSLVIPKDTNAADHGELENLYTEVRFLLLSPSFLSFIFYLKCLQIMSFFPLDRLSRVSTVYLPIVAMETV